MTTVTDSFTWYIPDITSTVIEELRTVRMANNLKFPWDDPEARQTALEFAQHVHVEVLLDYIRQSANLKDFLFSLPTENVREAQTQFQEEISRQTEDPNKEAAMSDEPCPNCDQKSVIFYLKQTRAADEPLTTFYECTNPACRKRWKR